MISYKITENDGLSRKITQQLSILPKELIDSWERNKAILAGGAIRSYFEGENPRDFDFFFCDPKEFNDLIQLLRGNNIKVSLIADNFFSFSFDKSEVDLVYFENAKSVIDILERFDFTISKGAYYKKCLIMHHDFVDHIREKKLAYFTNTDPNGSMAHCMYYLSKGYKIDNENLERINEDIEKNIK